MDSHRDFIARQPFTESLRPLYPPSSTNSYAVLAGENDAPELVAPHSIKQHLPLTYPSRSLPAHAPRLLPRLLPYNSLPPWNPLLQCPTSRHPLSLPLPRNHRPPPRLTLRLPLFYLHRFMLRHCRLPLHKLIPFLDRLCRVSTQPHLSPVQIPRIPTRKICYGCC